MSGPFRDTTQARILDIGRSLAEVRRKRAEAQLRYQTAVANLERKVASADHGPDPVDLGPPNLRLFKICFFWGLIFGVLLVALPMLLGPMLNAGVKARGA